MPRRVRFFTAAITVPDVSAIMAIPSMLPGPTVPSAEPAASEAVAAVSAMAEEAAEAVEVAADTEPPGNHS